MKILRKVIVSFVLLLLIVHTSISMALLVPSIQKKISCYAEETLSNLLGTKVKISKIESVFFTNLSIYDVHVRDSVGGDLLDVKKIAVNAKLFPLFHKTIHVGNIQLIGVDATLEKDSLNGEGNWQFILNRLQSKKKKEEEKKPFDLVIQLRSIILHDAHIRYRVKDMPSIPNYFSPNDLDIQHLNANLSLRHLSQDSIHVLVRNLNFEEQSGIGLKRLSFRLKANRKNALLTRLDLKTPNGEITSDSIKVDYSHVKEGKDYLSKSSFLVRLESKGFLLSDLKPLVPSLEKFSTPLELDCDISGTLDSIRIARLNIEVEDEVELQSDFFLQKLNLWDSLAAEGNIYQLTLYQEGLKKILSAFVPNMKKDLYEKLMALGDVEFVGSISGGVSEILNATGSLSTAIGEINTHSQYRLDNEKQQYELVTTIETEAFKLSSLLPQSKDFGEVSLNLSAELNQEKQGKPFGKIEGEISRFDFKGYSYSGIDLGMLFDSTNYMATLDVNDENVKFALEMEYANTSQKLQSLEMNILLEECKFDNLNLMEKFPKSNLSFSLDGQLVMDEKKDVYGNLLIKDLNFQHDKQGLHYDSITFNSDISSTGEREVSFSSDFLKADLKGYFKAEELLPLLLQMSEKKLPSLLKPVEGNYTSTQMDYSLRISPNDRESKVLNLPFVLKEPLLLSGKIDGKNHLLNTHLQAPDIRIKKKHLRDVSLTLNGNKKEATLALLLKNFSPTEESSFLSLKSTARNDSLFTFLHLNDEENKTITGELSFITSFMKREDFPKIVVDFLPTECHTEDISLQVAPSKVEIEKEHISIHNFSLKGGEQSLKIDGNISANANESLNVFLRNIDLGYIFHFLKIDGVSFGGYASGDVLAHNLLSAPKLEIGALKVRNFAYNDAPLGSAEIKSHWVNDDQSIHFLADITDKENRKSKVVGYYKIPDDSLVLNFDANHIKASCLRPFLGDILNNLDGEMSGKVSLYGPTKDLSLNGNAITHNLNFEIGVLGTKYSFSDTIHLYPEGLKLNRVIAYDKYNNQAEVNGEVKYTYFRDASFDIRLKTNRLLAYENTGKEGGMPILGNAFISGQASISGNESVVNIGGLVRTEEGSSIRYISPSNSSASNYQYITFVSPKDTLGKSWEEEENSPQETPEESSSDIRINLIVDANPNLGVEIVLDESTGDDIKVEGNGGIQASYSTNSDNLDIHGIYTISQGNCTFNLQKVITKKFQIAEGSSIRFNGGGFSNLGLDVHAIYNTTANLSDLDQGFQTELSRISVPVQCLLNIGGTLSAMNFSFGINIPNAGTELNRRVRNLIGSEDMMFQQVLYLLVLGRFYTPDYAASNTQKQGGEMSGIVSSAVSSQLNKVLGTMVNNWNINTRLRSRNEDYSDTEVEVALSGQLLNNRLLVNGNFGYRDKRYSLSNNNFIGDIDLEYKLTPSGMWRLKGYTHTNDRPSYYKSAPTTQGIGVSFRKEFDALRKNNSKKIMKDFFKDDKNGKASK